MTYRDDRLISGVPVMLASDPEKTDRSGARPELLGPLVADARAAVDNDAARTRVIDALAAHISEPLRARYRAELSERRTFLNKSTTWSGFDLKSGDTSLEIENTRSITSTSHSETRFGISVARSNALSHFLSRDLDPPHKTFRMLDIVDGDVFDATIVPKGE